MSGDRVIYSAIAGARDLPRPIAPPPGWRCVLFTDRTSAPGWERQPITVFDIDPARTAKVYKVMPHRFFPGIAYSLWIDGNILPASAPDDLVDRYLASDDIAVHRHPDRDCVFDEADVCARLGLDEAPVIEAQMNRYRRAGYSRGAGLAALGVVLRRHTDAIRTLNERWWQEIETGSRRDQLSFDVTSRALGLRYATFDSHCFDGPLFDYVPHRSAIAP